MSILLFKIPNPDKLHLQLFVNNRKYIYIKMAQCCQNRTEMCKRDKIIQSASLRTTETYSRIHYINFISKYYKQQD